MSEDEKIPLEKVLDDMHNPNGGLVSLAARDYYYIYYASAEQRKKMDREDKIANIISLVVGIVILATLILLFKT